MQSNHLFDFPVTAIIGPNGGGKTTILGAAGILYNDIKPRQFFARSQQFDMNMRDWHIEYEVIDKSIEPRDTIRRTASFKSEKWARNACNRSVMFFGVARTLPAVERTEMLKFAKSAYRVTNELNQINESLAEHITRVLGKNVSQYHLLENADRIDLLTGRTNDIDYSEFHFGAGESSVIKMISKIESATDSSLILIEEIENGLHPIATRNLVEYLVDVAKRKKLQIVFTTHSDYATDPLPPKAIWSAIDGSVFQGKLSVESLRSITGEIDTQLVIYVEDNFAKVWVETVIGQIKQFDFSCIEIHAMGGDGTAVRINKYHNQDPSTHVPSVCIIDGDSQQCESNLDKVFRLPGGVPESYIYDKVLEAWDAYGAKLVTMLTQPYSEMENTHAILKYVKESNRDPHLLFCQVGERLLIPEATANKAFIAIWCQAYPDEAKTVHNILDQNQLNAKLQ